jgi:uncharacterized protein
VVKNIAILFFFLLCLYLYIKYIESKGIYYPQKEIQLTPLQVNLPFDDVYIKTKDGLSINGWFISAPNAKYALLFLHGNAGNIGDRIDKISLLHEIGLNIFIIDYRGYGKSQGSPSEAGFYLDSQAAYDYLLNGRNLKAEQLILYGESLGTAVAIDLAYRKKSGAVIAEGAFSRGRDMARVVYPFLPAFLFADSFNSLKKIAGIGSPKLFMHSSEDEVVPFALAKKLYNAAKEPKRFEQLQGGHNMAFLDSKEKYISSISSFVKWLKESE